MKAPFANNPADPFANIRDTWQTDPLAALQQAQTLLEQNAAFQENPIQQGQIGSFYIYPEDRKYVSMLSNEPQDDLRNAYSKWDYYRYHPESQGVSKKDNFYKYYMRCKRNVFGKGYNDAITHILLSYLTSYETIKVVNAFHAYIALTCGGMMERCAKRLDKLPNGYHCLPNELITSLKDTSNIREEEQARYFRNFELTHREEEDSLIRWISNTVTKLKEENLLPDSFANLWPTYENNPKLANVLSTVVPYIMALTDYEIVSYLTVNLQIDNSIWEDAIELALALNNKYTQKSFNREKVRDSILNELMPSILVFGYLIATIRLTTTPEMLQIYDDYQKQADITESNHYEELVRLIEAIKSLNNSLKKKDEDIRQLQKQLKTMHDLSKSIASDKEISMLVHEHNQEIKMKDAEIEELTRRIEQMEQDRLDMERAAYQSDQQYIPDKPWLDINLPQKGVLFLGGHTNMTKRLKQIYPNWSYVIAENDPFPTKYEIAFIWSNHISHGTWWRLNNNSQDRSNYAYLTATNINRLIEEAKYEYWKFKNLKAKEN